MMTREPMPTRELAARYDAARVIVTDAAALAMRYFRDVESLEIDRKGQQDWVSNADRDVETAIREALLARFPDDGVLGEEHGQIASRSGFTWVIDPIDGTTSFVNGMPGWCTVLAGIDAAGLAVGVLRDPVVGETFAAVRDGGATLDGQPISVARVNSLDAGTLAIAHNTRVGREHTLELLEHILAAGGLYYRTGSGALMLAYVAAGRLIGYAEPHMNSWDCLAALLLIEEAGGCVQPFDLDTMLAHGGRVVTSTPGVFDELTGLTDRAYRDT